MAEWLYFYQYLLVILFLTFISKISSLYFAYPNSITLKNGNILIVHQDGITICDSSFNEIIKNVTFFTSKKLDNEEDLFKVIIDQFDDGYVFCFIFNKIYIIDNDGELEFNETLVPYNDTYTTLALEKVENKNYYYLIGYIYQKYINLFYYIYNSLNQTNQKYTELLNFKRESYHEIKNKGLTCQFLFHNKENIITCFYYVFAYGQNKYLGISYFLINNNTKSFTNNNNNNLNKEIRRPINFIKSVISSDHSKIFIGVYHTEEEITSLIYYFYKYVDIYSYSLYNDYCSDKKYTTIQLAYSDEKDAFSFSCISKGWNSIFVCTYDRETESKIFSLKNRNFTCNNFHQYSLLHLKAKNNYYILSDLICDQKENSFIKIFNDKNEEKEEE